jgi:hypothetical protein
MPHTGRARFVAGIGVKDDHRANDTEGMRPSAFVLWGYCTALCAGGTVSSRTMTSVCSASWQFRKIPTCCTSLTSSLG